MPCLSGRGYRASSWSPSEPCRGHAGEPSLGLSALANGEVGYCFPAPLRANKFPSDIMGHGILLCYPPRPPHPGLLPNMLGRIVPRVVIRGLQMRVLQSRSIGSENVHTLARASSPRVVASISKDMMNKYVVDIKPFKRSRPTFMYSHLVI